MVPKSEFDLSSGLHMALIPFRESSDLLYRQHDSLFDSFSDMEELVASLELNVPLVGFSPFDAFSIQSEADIQQSSAYDDERINSFSGETENRSGKNYHHSRLLSSLSSTAAFDKEIRAFGQSISRHAGDFSVAQNALLPAEQKSRNLVAAKLDSAVEISELFSELYEKNSAQDVLITADEAETVSTVCLINEFAEAVIQFESNRENKHHSNNRQQHDDESCLPDKVYSVSDEITENKISSSAVIPGEGKTETILTSAKENDFSSDYSGNEQTQNCIREIDFLAEALITESRQTVHAQASVSHSEQQLLPSNRQTQKSVTDAAAANISGFDSSVVKLFNEVNQVNQTHETAMQKVNADQLQRRSSHADIHQPPLVSGNPSLPSDTLTSLVNDALVEQARRHGVDLS